MKNYLKNYVNHIIFICIAVEILSLIILVSRKCSIENIILLYILPFILVLFITILNNFKDSNKSNIDDKYELIDTLDLYHSKNQFIQKKKINNEIIYCFSCIDREQNISTEIIKENTENHVIVKKINHYKAYVEIYKNIYDKKNVYIIYLPKRLALT
ncbi:5'-nucleotidase [Clostridium botulinum]|nr:5'-nucleotidase [Clostridium botulinum]